ncbi:GNAT family N-acetyltransferase [Pseudovibrio sp. Tun.PSC04-5.I4]|uniref:GNAT family N-acetyltransferase n=1 Tax=Pseudovibrio sp. Tun.PSC04-5.I4 TaxID=1798213 RepID=UPI00088F9664|nr:GNAT family N-acetyltransferase [Pseudovibrio sp. Tun.PSC04-5.I4]SDR11844.1 Acetyltransferase (GNAT) family protein [Pseudovibrio sp. Tun.PSC04-5.I4]
MQDNLVITDLKNVPQFLEQAAQGMWLEWWEEEGHPIEDVYEELRSSLGTQTLPTTLIAHDEEQFLGMVMLVKSDMSKRPQYTPWLASLWVAPDHRGKGVGSRLAKELKTHTFSSGANQLYLFAKPSLRGFYETLGWRCIEDDVNGVDIFIKERRVHEHSA